MLEVDEDEYGVIGTGIGQVKEGIGKEAASAPHILILIK
jgi:hypothetical protein